MMNRILRWAAAGLMIAVLLYLSIRAQREVDEVRMDRDTYKARDAEARNRIKRLCADVDSKLSVIQRMGEGSEQKNARLLLEGVRAICQEKWTGPYR